MDKMLGVNPTASLSVSVAAPQLQLLTQNEKVNQRCKACNWTGKVLRQHLNKNSECRKQLKVEAKRISKEKNCERARNKYHENLEESLRKRAYEEKSFLVHRSPEEEKIPKDINCPHCDGFVHTSPNESNIMLHIRDNHKEVENLKCPFCSEFKRGFTLLSHHVQAAHYTDYTKYVNVILGLQNEEPVEDPL